jgi:hypothetical protein
VIELPFHFITKNKPIEQCFLHGKLECILGDSSPLLWSLSVWAIGNREKWLYAMFLLPYACIGVVPRCFSSNFQNKKEMFVRGLQILVPADQCSLVILHELIQNSFSLSEWHAQNFWSFLFSISVIPVVIVSLSGSSCSSVIQCGWFEGNTTCSSSPG